VKASRRLHRIGIRFVWGFGCALLLLHVAIAFHLGHNWSHQAAWNHTQQISGFGDGIYVNYAFALVWLADAVWLCTAFESYCARPRWLSWTIHGFLAFIVFNAAVVFGSPSSRTALAFGLLPVLVLLVLGWRFISKLMNEPPSPQ
jgi:hypothetical protein